LNLSTPTNTTAESISVVVVDDHPLFRDAMSRIIEGRDDMHLVDAVSSGGAAIDSVHDHHPTVCVLDLELPDMNGMRVIARLNSEQSETRILVVSGHCDSESVYEVIEAGASGIEMKTAGSIELGAAIAAVASGETVLPEELLDGIAQQIRSRRSEAGPALSEREIEIISAVARGLPAGQIASELNLAESTIKTHLTRIYDKLGVSERAAAVAVAIRHGLID
jgi:two-component system nitrate/nitrite response regulator NarL